MSGRRGWAVKNVPNRAIVLKDIIPKDRGERWECLAQEERQTKIPIGVLKLFRICITTKERTDLPITEPSAGNSNIEVFRVIRRSRAPSGDKELVIRRGANCSLDRENTQE